MIKDINDYDERHFGSNFLNDIVEWVGSSLDLNQVFDSETIKEWVAANYNPGDVFPDDELGAWAESNGYIVDNSDSD